MSIGVLAAVKVGLALITEGRQAIEGIRDAIRDGKQAVDADELDELEALLEQEQAETAAAHQSLKDAIAKARSKG